MHIQHEAADSQRVRANPNQRLDIERFEQGIDTDVVAIPNDMAKIHGLAVDQNQIDFRMRYTERLNHILDGSPPLEFVNETDLASRERQKVVQLLIKPHLTLAFQQLQPPRKPARRGRGSQGCAEPLFENNS
jgi:hypothetical protein